MLIRGPINRLRRNKYSRRVTMMSDPIAKANLTPREIALIKVMLPQEWEDYERREITNGDYWKLIDAAGYARKLAPLETPLLKLVDRAHTAAARTVNATERSMQRPGTETGRKARERADHWWKEFESLLSQ